MKILMPIEIVQNVFSAAVLVWGLVFQFLWAALLCSFTGYPLPMSQVEFPKALEFKSLSKHMQFPFLC